VWRHCNQTLCVHQFAVVGQDTWTKQLETKYTWYHNILDLS
jgi:hypothetical protein